MSIDDQRYAALTLQSLRVTIGPLQASTTSLESQESYLTAGMLPYNRNVTLQTFLSSTRDFYRLHSTFAQLYNAAAFPASRLRSAGSLAINTIYPSELELKDTTLHPMKCVTQESRLVTTTHLSIVVSTTRGMTSHFGLLIFLILTAGRKVRRQETKRAAAEQLDGGHQGVDLPASLRCTSQAAVRDLWSVIAPSKRR